MKFSNGVKKLFCEVSGDAEQKYFHVPCSGCEQDACWLWKEVVMVAAVWAISFSGSLSI